MFEAAGVARAERSIINWCQPNRQGIARLDSYYDPNERKYFITSQSVETVIKEEIHRMKKASEVPVSETFGSNVEHVKHLTDEHMMQTDGRRIQTVRGYVKNICHKMHVRSRIEAVIKHRAGYS
jgi:hypothetical protein